MNMLRRHLASLLVGALAVGGIAYVGARELTAQPAEVVLAQENEETPEGERARPRRGMRPHLRGAIRGELVVPGSEDGTFRTVRIDRGVLDRVDGSTVVINEDDGTTVEIPTSDTTRISRDRDQATLADFEEGDHIHALRVNEGDGFVTQSVHAISAERWAERQERREACRADPEQCRPRRSEAEPLTGGSALAS